MMLKGTTAPGALLAAAMLAAMAGPAPAAETTQVRHFFDCLGWMLSDPALHAANCSANGSGGPAGGAVDGTSGRFADAAASSAGSAGGAGGPRGPPPAGGGRG